MAAPPLVEDDTTYNDGGTVDDTYASTQYTSSTHPGAPNGAMLGKKQNPILTKLFMTCENDALGSVHRAWAVTVLFMVVFFIVAIIEGELVYIIIYVFMCVSLKGCCHWDYMYFISCC